MIVKSSYDKKIEEISVDAPIEYDTFKEVADELVALRNEIEILKQSDFGTIEDFESAMVDI